MKAHGDCPHRRFTGVRCTGQVLTTGYCDTCGRSRTARPIPRGTGDHGPGAAEPLALPSLEPPADPAELLEPNGRLPRHARVCGNEACRALIAPPLVQEPVPDEGWCPECGVPFSFVSPLRQGELLHDQYEVRGFIAHGGQGWVHLAADKHLSPNHVAVKGLLNRHNERLARLAEKERRHLIALNHRGIVRILDFVRHQPTGNAKTAGAAAGNGRRSEPPTHYIVMEYVGRSTLHDIITRTRQGKLPLGTPLDIEHVVTYGYLILDALTHLHDNGLVYVDMKPSNVMHFHDQIKIIDLGAVRSAGDRETDLVVTERYAAPEVRETRPTVAHDLHTVGRTLEELADYAVSDVPGLGITSFRRVLERATHPVAERRFSSAREMAGQLRGALREIRALRGSRDRPEPSRYFLPSPTLLGHDLGGIPPIEHWLDRKAPARTEPPASPPLDPAVPSAGTVALGLPVPLPHPNDPRAEIFGLASYSPDQVLRQLPEQPSAEVCFHNVRRLLSLDGREPLEAADRELAAGVRILGAGATLSCWRVAWHSGLLALARSESAHSAGDQRRELAQLNRARRHFTTVMNAMPGEYAPKLAVAYCTERLPATAAVRHPSAAELYQAVWLRNPAHGSAAFGLARLALARGARAEAIGILDQVPEEARGHTAARVAALRVRAARLATADGQEQLPTLADLRDAQLRLAEACKNRSPNPDVVPAGDPQLRLRAELLEWALDMLYRAEADGGLLAGPEEGPATGPASEAPHYPDLLGPPPAWRSRELPGQPAAAAGRSGPGSG
ncbi:MAG: tetratricopeptide repeat protein, partial [Streptomyces sp.]|uniref:tetratricopeptide repeat protein n=1 Tax=Streptomyces sp. TaxID=1931 RepID=UPI003D6A8D55